MSQVYTNTFESIFVNQLVANAFGQPVNVPSNINATGSTTLNNLTVTGTFAIPVVSAPTLTTDNLNGLSSIEILRLSNNKLQLGNLDAFNRKQIWDLYTNDPNPCGPGYSGRGSILRLGSLSADGDATNIISEGEVIYGLAPNGLMNAGNYAFARIKPLRFQLLANDGAGNYDILKINDSALTYKTPDRGFAGDNILNINTTNMVLDANLLVNAGKMIECDTINPKANTIVDFPNGASVSELIIDPLTAVISLNVATVFTQATLNCDHSIKTASSNISVIDGSPDNPIGFNMGASDVNCVKLKLNKTTGLVSLSSIGTVSTMQEWDRTTAQTNLYGEVHTPSGNLIAQNSAAKKFNLTQIAPHITLYRQGNGTDTVITTSATYTKGVNSFSTGLSNNFTANIALNGVIYTGTQSKLVKVNYSIWLSGATVAGIFNTAVALNPTYNGSNELTSTTINGSICESSVAVAAQYQCVSACFYVVMVTNDILEVVCTNETGTDDVSMRGGSFTCEALSYGLD